MLVFPDPWFLCTGLRLGDATVWAVRLERLGVAVALLTAWLAVSGDFTYGDFGFGDA